MKTLAAVLLEMGRPRPYAQSRPLEVTEVDLDGPGPGEVLVEIRAAGLCHSDLSVMDGNRPRPVPMVLGHEAAGIVREVGMQVEGLTPGDPVVFSYVPMCGRCEYCAIGRPALCVRGAQSNTKGTLLGGQKRFRWKGRELHHHMGVSGFSQYTVAAQESLIKISPEFPLEKAALFGCAIMTGVGAVVNTARLEAGSSVAVFGLGGVGLASVMGAAMVGAHPIVAVDILGSKLDKARELGATHTINASEVDPVEAIREITAGGAMYTFEAVGNVRALEQAYAATRRGGEVISMGLPHPEAKVSIPAVSLIAEEKTLRGSYMGSSVPRRDALRFMALHQAGQLPVEALVTHTISLEEINQGFDRLASGEAVRQVLKFG